jgi:competence protein ComGC
MKKGMSLPVNTVVILGIAVLVMLLVVSFLFNGFDPNDVTAKTEIEEKCLDFRTMYDCDVEKLSEIQTDYKNMDLYELLQNEGYDTEQKMLKRCNCD